jgi:hypothetical protein
MGRDGLHARFDGDRLQIGHEAAKEKEAAAEPPLSGFR